MNKMISRTTKTLIRAIFALALTLGLGGACGGMEDDVTTTGEALDLDNPVVAPGAVLKPKSTLDSGCMKTCSDQWAACRAACPPYVFGADNSTMAQCTNACIAAYDDCMDNC